MNPADAKARANARRLILPGRRKGVHRDVEKICQACGQSYHVCRSKTNRTKYCSRKCSNTMAGRHTTMPSMADFLEQMKDRDGCWEWAHRNDKGYGRCILDGRRHMAHRASYIVTFGEIPHGLLVCHRCDNPACVRPDHLFVGTYLDNNRDMANKGRVARGPMKPQAKLTESLVREIRADPRPAIEICRQYGVHVGTIHRVRSRHIWAHVG